MRKKDYFLSRKRRQQHQDIGGRKGYAIIKKSPILIVTVTGELEIGQSAKARLQT